MTFKKHIYLYAFAWIFFITATLFGEGFIRGTLVCTPQGYVAIEELAVGDQVITCDFDMGYAVESIVNVSSHEIVEFIQLKIGDVIIEVDADHAFFIPFTQEWIQASHLVEGICVLSAPLQAECIESSERIEQKSYVYSLSLANHHNYLVSQRNIIAHNFGGSVVFSGVGAVKGTTVLNAFLLANPSVAPVIICAGGVVLIGYVTWTFWHAFKESRNIAQNDKGNNSGQHRSLKQKRNKHDNNQPPKKNDNDPASNGAAAVALLNAIDESKEKVIEVFNKTCEWLMTTNNGLQAITHAFRRNCGHNFGPLLTRMGANIANQNDVLRVGSKIIIDVTQKLIAMGSKLPLNNEGVYYNILVEYEGEIITVRGRIIDGIFKMSTMFIQPQHVR